MESVYSFCSKVKDFLKKKEGDKGIMEVKMFSKFLRVYIRELKNNDLPYKKVKEFGKFVIEKHKITNFSICYDFILRLADCFSKMEEYSVPIEEWKDLGLNRETNILFKNVNGRQIAVGYLEDNIKQELRLEHVRICENNGWIWDFNSASQSAKYIGASPFVTALK